ncbi:MAG: hypothetical protein ACREO8_01800 [Luteimonas sp.]
MTTIKKNCSACDDSAARVATWGLEVELVQRLVTGAKRSAAYRKIRNQLLARCPVDVWIEDDMGFVHFNLTQVQGSELGWAIFAIDPRDGQLKAAKVLVPDARGETVIVTELHVAEALSLAA